MGNKSGASRRTDIPYAQRLQLQRRAEIVANREEAELVARCSGGDKQRPLLPWPPLLRHIRNRRKRPSTETRLW